MASIIEHIDMKIIMMKAEEDNLEGWLHARYKEAKKTSNGFDFILDLKIKISSLYFQTKALEKHREEIKKEMKGARKYRGTLDEVVNG